MDSLTLSNVFDYQAFLDTVFEIFLIERHVSGVTRKNYRSDLKNFFNWLIDTGKTSRQASPKNIKSLIASITTEQLEEYKRNLLLSHTPQATINRRLSALRMFFHFAQTEGVITNNPMTFIRNIVISESSEPSPQKLRDQFRNALKDEGASEITIKNYLADVDEFLVWLSQNP